MSELLSDERFHEDMGRHGLPLGVCLPPPNPDDLFEMQALTALWQHVEGCRPLCVVTSPRHGRLLDFEMEIAAVQLRKGRHFGCMDHIDFPNEEWTHEKLLVSTHELRTK